MPQDAIDQFVALPKEERGRLFEQLPPEKQHKLLDEIKKRKSPKQDDPAPPHKAGLTELEYIDPKAPALSLSEAGKAVHNIVAGAANLALHPIRSFQAMGEAQVATGMSPNGYPMFAPTFNAQRDAANQKMILDAQQGQAAAGAEFRKHPLENLEAMLGQAALTEGAGKFIPKATRTLIDTRNKVVTGITGTGPKATAELVKEVEAENASSAANAEHANTQAAAKHLEQTQDSLHEQQGRETLHAQELRKKAQEIREKDTADAATRAENQRLTDEHQRAVAAHKQDQVTVNNNDRVAKTGLKQVEERVHAEANQKYEDLKPKLNKFEADPETVAEIADHAIEMLDPSVPKPPIFEKFQNFIKNNTLTYDVLDGFRSTIGAALRKGGLSGPTYHLYEVMLEGDSERGIPGIIDEMDRIAETRGLKAEADAARSSWRKWAEAFRDRNSPLRTILHDPEAHGLLRNMRGQQSYLDRLRAFGDDGKHLADQIEANLKAAQKVKAQFTAYGDIKIPEPKAPSLAEVGEPSPVSPEQRAGETVKPPDRPEFPDRPAEVVPTQEKIGEVDIRKAKLDALNARRGSIVHRINQIATVGGPSIAVYSILRSLRGGTLAAGLEGAIDVDIGSGVVWGVGKAFDSMLQSPKIVDFLTKPTAQDIATIPPELRGDLAEFAKSAQAKGVKVNPKLLGALGIALPQTRTQYLKDLREKSAYTDKSDSQQ